MFKKNWLASKTLWTSSFAFAVVVSAEIFADPATAIQVEKFTAGILPVVMFFLRFVTRHPLS